MRPADRNRHTDKSVSPALLYHTVENARQKEEPQSIFPRCSDILHIVFFLYTGSGYKKEKTDLRTLSLFSHKYPHLPHNIDS